MSHSGISENQMNCALPPDSPGFTLNSSAYMDASSRVRSTSTSSPFGLLTTQHTPEERRTHLIHVLECAMAILNDEDHQDTRLVVGSTQTRRVDETGPLSN